VPGSVLTTACEKCPPADYSRQVGLHSFGWAQGAASLAGSHLGVAVGVGRVAVAKPAASVYS